MTLAHWVALAVVLLFATGVVERCRRRGNAAVRHCLSDAMTRVAVRWLVILAVAAIVAPWLAPFRPSRQLDIVALVNQAPSWTHPFGTDSYSRDVYSRMLYGARVSLGVGVFAMVVAVIAGGTIGVVAGYFRRGIDGVLMRLVDVGLAVPRIFLVLVVTALWSGLALGPLVLLLGLTGWFATSRLVRSEVLALRDAPFVEASRAAGASPLRVMLRDVTPNAAAPMIVSAALGIGNVMLLEAALSFLGVGVQPPAASWGNLIADGRDQLMIAPWTTLIPGIAVALSVMAFNTVGDALEQALDPRRSDPSGSIG
ncbi:MAG TPA: ABC transporter permease [Gemmatimonadales bacterium]|jgi:peptide/nickel transport system permease protein